MAGGAGLETSDQTMGCVRTFTATARPKPAPATMTSSRENLQAASQVLRSISMCVSGTDVRLRGGSGVIGTACISETGSVSAALVTLASICSNHSSVLGSTEGEGAGSATGWLAAGASVVDDSEGNAASAGATAAGDVDSRDSGAAIADSEGNAASADADASITGTSSISPVASATVGRSMTATRRW